MADAQQLAMLQKKATLLRRDVVEMIGAGKTGHLGGSCSAAEIVTALYFHKMRLDPKNPGWEQRDRFLLSKGHAVLIQYAALAEQGYFPKEELGKVKHLGAMLQGHPDKTKTPGIEANTGSLGQGLSIACGMALGLRLDGSEGRVYVIIGDGEMAEGQIWEAAMAAANFKLDHLVAILDRNRIQATGRVEERFNTNPVKEKWEAFGWHVMEIEGNDMAQVIDALDKADTVNGKPVMIIANTIKGCGVSFAEDTAAFHNGMMTDEQYDMAVKELSGV